jgi:hypothetical protein
MQLIYHDQGEGNDECLESPAELPGIGAESFRGQAGHAVEWQESSGGFGRVEETQRAAELPAQPPVPSPAYELSGPTPEQGRDRAAAGRLDTEPAEVLICSTSNHTTPRHPTIAR